MITAMKKIKLLNQLLITGHLADHDSVLSCTDLKEEVYSAIPLDSFFRTEQDVLMNAGRAYTKLAAIP
jgi:hypothetical protein